MIANPPRHGKTAISQVLADADTCSLKRLAWAYGCAPKGGSEEMQLEMLLLKRCAGDLNEIAASWAAVASEAIVEGERLRELVDQLDGNERT